MPLFRLRCRGIPIVLRAVARLDKPAKAVEAAACQLELVERAENLLVALV